MNRLTFTTICKFRRRLFHTKRGIRSRPERSDGVKYQPENERPNRRSEIGAAQGVLIIFLANRIGDWHEAVIIAALQIAVDEIAKSEGPK